MEGFSCDSAGKESACNAGDLGLIPGLGRFPGDGNGYQLQYSGLENSNDCIVHGVTRVGLDWVTFTFTFMELWKTWSRVDEHTFEGDGEGCNNIVNKERIFLRNGLKIRKNNFKPSFLPGSVRFGSRTWENDTVGKKILFTKLTRDGESKSTYSSSWYFLCHYYHK